MHIHICVYIRMCVCVTVCMYVRIYVQLLIYIYIYIYPGSKPKTLETTKLSFLIEIKTKQEKVHKINGHFQPLRANEKPLTETRT